LNDVKRPRYASLIATSLLDTDAGLALEAQEKDGRLVYVMVTPSQLQTLAASLPTVVAKPWFKERLETAWTRLRDTVTGPAS
jgi:hypothetical protein